MLNSVTIDSNPKNASSLFQDLTLNFETINSCINDAEDLYFQENYNGALQSISNLFILFKEKSIIENQIQVLPEDELDQSFLVATRELLIKNQFCYPQTLMINFAASLNNAWDTYLEDKRVIGNDKNILFTPIHQFLNDIADSLTLYFKTLNAILERMNNWQVEQNYGNIVEIYNLFIRYLNSSFIKVYDEIKNNPNIEEEATLQGLKELLKTTTSHPISLHVRELMKSAQVEELKRDLAATGYYHPDLNDKTDFSYLIKKSEEEGKSLFLFRPSTSAKGSLGLNIVARIFDKETKSFQKHLIQVNRENDKNYMYISLKRELDNGEVISFDSLDKLVDFFKNKCAEFDSIASKRSEASSSQVNQAFSAPRPIATLQKFNPQVEKIKRDIAALKYYYPDLPKTLDFSFLSTLSKQSGDSLFLLRPASSTGSGNLGINLTACTYNPTSNKFGKCLIEIDCETDKGSTTLSIKTRKAYGSYHEFKNLNEIEDFFGNEGKAFKPVIRLALQPKHDPSQLTTPFAATALSEQKPQ